MSAPSSGAPANSSASASSSGVGMKNLMKGVKKRLSTEQMRAAWEKDGQRTDVKTETNWQELSSLPRCRMARLISRDVIIHSLPSLRDATPASRRALLIKKLRLCSYVFSFDDTPDSPNDSKDKEVKRATLLELVNYLTVFKPAFSDEELQEIFEMLAANLFRPLPPSTQESTGMFNPEEDEPSSEPTWPHLQVVYEFLLRLATSTETDSKLLDKYFSRKFVLQLLELFDSEDPRERDYLKTILHRIYGNFMSLRPFIRRAINNVFYKFIYETDRHNGIAELLEILGSIINGFALPLKEQHKQFLQRVLLPLHKVTYVSVFHPQLSYCVTQFLEKDQTLAPRIVLAVLKFWPVTSSKKELMFLNELEEILDRIQSHHLANAQIPLFRQIGRSINSPHFQVSERAIYVLNNDVILRFITNNREQLVPILSRALISNTYNKEITGSATPAGGAAGPAAGGPASGSPRMGGGEFPGAGKGGEKKKGTGTVMCGGPPDGRKWYELGHWNPTIVELTADILKLFNEMDNSLMQRCNKNVSTLVKQNQQNLERRKQRWEQLREQAQQISQTSTSTTPTQTSTPSHTISVSPALNPQTRASPSFMPSSPGGGAGGFGSVSPAPLSASS